MSTATMERAERTIVPFGALQAQAAFSIDIDPSTFGYDAERQVNLTRDGGLWANEPVAASSTATNNDSTGGADEQSDPYNFVGDARTR